jgi:hypothetical protein
MDHPRLIGWSSPYLTRRRFLTSLVVVAGTPLAGSKDLRESFGRLVPCGSDVRSLNLRDQDRRRDRPLRDEPRAGRDAFRRIALDRVAPAAVPRLSRVTESIA